MMAVVPERRASTPQCIAETAMAAAGVLIQDSGPAQPSSPRGSWRISCRTHISSGRGLMRPRAQCSTLCVWPLTKPGTSMRSEQSSSIVPGGQSTSSERVPPGATRFRTPSAMRTSRRVYVPGSEASLGTSAPRSRVGGPAGGAGEGENFPTELSSVRSMVAEPPVRACAHPRAPICAGGRFLNRRAPTRARLARRRPTDLPSVARTSSSHESHTTQMPNWNSGCPIHPHPKKQSVRNARVFSENGDSHSWLSCHRRLIKITPRLRPPPPSPPPSPPPLAGSPTSPGTPACPPP